jgi:hypothetical protein
LLGAGKLDLESLWFGRLELGAAVHRVIGAARVGAFHDGTVGGGPTTAGRRTHPILEAASIVGFGRRTQVNVQLNWSKAGGLVADHCQGSGRPNKEEKDQGDGEETVHGGNSAFKKGGNEK